MGKQRVYCESILFIMTIVHNSTDEHNDKNTLLDKCARLNVCY